GRLALRDIHIHANELRLPGFAGDFKNGRQAPAFLAVAPFKPELDRAGGLFILTDLRQLGYERGPLLFGENQLFEFLADGLLRSPSEHALGSLVPEDHPSVGCVTLNGDLGRMLYNRTEPGFAGAKPFLETFLRSL